MSGELVSPVKCRCYRTFSGMGQNPIVGLCNDAKETVEQGLGVDFLHLSASNQLDNDFAEFELYFAGLLVSYLKAAFVFLESLFFREEKRIS